MIDYTKTSDGLYAYRWPRASVTADAVLFANYGDPANFNLWGERRQWSHPRFSRAVSSLRPICRTRRAFPGGFLEMDETVARCAERELEEETGIVLTGMQLVGIYSDVERDPRGRVITAAYAAMTTMPEATASDDAAAAKWWPLNDLPPLAFDHETILRDAKRVMNIKD